VSLTVTNNVGSNTITKTGYIVVSEDTGPGYCEPSNIDNSSDYISSVNIDGTSGASGRGEFGYDYYNTSGFQLPAGGSYAVSLSPYNSKNRNFWRIWIDFNGDGDFDDTGETVFTANNKKGPAIGTISIPSGLSGITRMRISMRTGSSPAPCDDNFGGEVEDYDVDIIAGGIIGGLQFEQDIDDSELVINIFPNPVKDILTIHTGKVPEESTIRIFNIFGKEMIWQSVTSDNTELDLSSFTKGVYFMIFRDQSQQIMKKFVKD